MNVKIEESWRRRLQEEFDKPYFKQLTDFVRYEYAHEHVLPQGSQIFHMFNACPFEKVKVVILGQDPYPTPGLYYGVCFSVPEGTVIPASLMNIFKEIHQDWVNLFLRPVIWIDGWNKEFFNELCTYGQGLSDGFSP